MFIGALYFGDWAVCLQSVLPEYIACRASCALSVCMDLSACWLAESLFCSGRGVACMGRGRGMMQRVRLSHLIPCSKLQYIRLVPSCFTRWGGFDDPYPSPSCCPHSRVLRSVADSICALDQRNAVPSGFVVGFVRHPPAAACHGPPQVSFAGLSAAKIVSSFVLFGAFGLSSRHCQAVQFVLARVVFRSWSWCCWRSLMPLPKHGVTRKSTPRARCLKNGFLVGCTQRTQVGTSRSPTAAEDPVPHQRGPGGLRGVFPGAGGRAVLGPVCAFPPQVCFADRKHTVGGTQ